MIKYRYNIITEVRRAGGYGTPRENRDRCPGFSYVNNTRHGIRNN